MKKISSYRDDPFPGISFENKQEIEKFCKKHGIEYFWRFDSLWCELILRTKKDDIQWDYRIYWKRETTARDVIIPMAKIYNITPSEILINLKGETK